jgi:hypothetical protein
MFLRAFLKGTGREVPALGPECTIKADRIECGREVFTYTEKRR